MRFLVCVLCLGVALSAVALETETVRYEQDGTALVGYLAYDPAIAGPRPLVMVVHEWWGLNEHPKAAAERLAKAGYVGFAVDMYGEGKAPAHADEASAWAGEIRENPHLAIDRLQAALDAIKEREAVDPERVAVIGYCFGGTVALETARMGWAPMDAAVSFHGSLESSVPGDERKLKAAVLVNHGAADTFVPESDLVALREELAKAGVDWELNIYGGAKHSFTNPKSDSYGMEGVGYNKAADERSWAAMMAFLDDVLR